MSTIAWVLLGALVTVLVGMSGLQMAMARRARASIGGEAPAAAGPPTEKPAAFYFYSPSCGPCRVMAPTVDALAAEGRDVRKVDVSQDLQTAMAFGVMATPTTVVVRGGKVQEVLLGVVPRAKLEALLA